MVILFVLLVVIKNVHARFAETWILKYIYLMVYGFFHRVSFDGWELMSENNGFVV